jgi:hypothetical protein
VEGVWIVRAFTQAMTAWREGRGSRRLEDCPACGGQHDLAELTFRPPAGFATRVLHLTHVGRATLRPDARAVLERAWGTVRVVGRRVS